MHIDRLQEALRIAAASTLERIRQDSERLPAPMSVLVAYVAEHLFDPELNGTRARRAVGIRSNSLPARFLARMKMSLGDYIELARLEVADRLIRRNEFDVSDVSMAVGYKSHATFLRAYKPWTGELPSEVGPKPYEPEVEYQTWRRYCCREFEPEVGRKIKARLNGLYPDSEQQPGGEPSSPQQLIVIDSEAYMRTRAEEIWREIRDLAPEEQRRRLLCYEFRSRALFDLLREKSRQKGRLDRQQGVNLAELALVSLANLDEFFGDRIHDLRALGHACVGNALRLARDLPAANEAFERAEAEWRMPRRNKDYRIRARMHDFEASLRILQRSYGEALSLVERCQERYQLAGDMQGEVRVLIQRAAVYGYTGKSEQAIEALQVARDLLDDQKDPYLAFVLHSCLANDQAKVAHYQSAKKTLDQTRAYCSRLDHPLGVLKIQWLDAMIHLSSGDTSAAEPLLVAARMAYAEARDLSSFGIISLDLAILYAEQGRWTRVLELVSEAVPILASIQLHPETVEAVDLLAKAIETGEVSSSQIRQVREAILQDPLATASTS